MRVLMVSTGSRGDVQPLLALALALRSRGHDVHVAAPPDFQAWVGELGLPFTPWGGHVEAALNRHAGYMGAHPARVLCAAMANVARETPGWIERTVRAARGFDTIVSTPHYAARSVAERLEVPWISVVYTPTLLRSAYHPPLPSRRQGSPRWMNALAWKAFDALTHRALAPGINAIRDSWGLPALDSVPRHLEGLPILLACDPVVSPAPPDWAPLRVTTTGPLFYEDDAPLDPAVEAFLDAGPPPVFVGFGSAPARDAAGLTRAVVSGAGRRA